MSPRVRLQEAFKLALSMVLFYWLALWMDWDLPKFGALSIVIISRSTTGASLNKGFMRVAGTGLGALAGFVLLSWFAQSPSGMLIAVSAWLVFVGYFLQASRQGDIWFNAGFLAVAVWSSSYLKVDTAFHFATTRFLETAAGVLLFTLVSALLWPRTSGAALQLQGQSVWSTIQQLFTACRQQLENASEADDANRQRTELATGYQQFLATLDAACADTPAVGAKKHVWEILRVNLRTFASAQELWRESIQDCHKLELQTLLPQLHTALNILAQRLEHGRQLWEEQRTATKEAHDLDAVLLDGLDIAVDQQAFRQLQPAQQAALMNFLAQLHILDNSSRDLLRTLRVLAGSEPASALAGYPVTDPFKPASWNPERLLKAMFPALCWIAGYVFWFFLNPPGGPAIPMMCAAFGLMMVMAPVPLFGLLMVLLLSMFIVVAPVYMLIMPQLENGYALLLLIFVYTFIFACLGGKSPVLKLGPLAMFVMMVDINNQQFYSFILLATAGLVMLLGVSIVLFVQRMLSPMHPEHVLLRSVQRFLRGSTQIVSRYQPRANRNRARLRRHRKRDFENRILPVAAQLPLLEKSLDYSLFPDNTPDKVQQLIGNLLTVRQRLQSLEATYTAAESSSTGLLSQLADINDRWNDRIGATLRRWSELELDSNSGQAGNSADAFTREMAVKLGQIQASSDSDRQAEQGLYALIGSTQSLLDALDELGRSMQQLNWRQWSAARF